MFYRLKKRLNYGYFAHRTRHVLASAPIACDPGAPCEIHTMLSAEDTPLYLVAVKSLLRFHSSVAIVVHSDGTLRPRHEELVRRHIPGCRVVSAAEADEKASSELGAGSFLRQCRDFDASYRRMIDSELWSKTKRRIIMDSDLLVLRPPRAVIEWMDRGGPPFVMGQPPKPKPPGAVAPLPASKPANRHVQSIFKDELPRMAEALGWPATFLDGGCGAFYGDSGGALSLDKVERLVSTCLDLGVPMREWGGEQCTVIYLLSVAGASRLDPDRYFNFWPDRLDKVDAAEVVHFIGTNRFYRNVYVQHAESIVASLATQRPASA